MWGSGPFSMDPPSGKVPILRRRAGCVYGAHKSYRETWNSWSWARMTWTEETDWRAKPWKSARRQWRRWRSDPRTWQPESRFALPVASSSATPFLPPKYEAYKHPIPQARRVEVDDHEHRKEMLAWRWRGSVRQGGAFPWQDPGSKQGSQCYSKLPAASSAPSATPVSEAYNDCNPWAAMVAMDEHDPRKETLAWKWRAIATCLTLEDMKSRCLFEARRGAAYQLRTTSDMLLSFQHFSM